jgi:hypothetical protein
MHKTKMKFLLFVLIVLLIPGILSAKTVAFVGVQNLSQNPDYDYLASFTEGLILFDVSSAKEIILVERTRLEKILSEQNLQVSGLAGEGKEKKTIEIGKLLAADYLVSVDYTIVAGEVAFTLRMADTTTGEVRVFTSRGTLENDIHSLAEGLVRSLAGKNYSFTKPGEKRSLLTLRDLQPGTISLYSNLVNAEILLNDKFAGYTKGDLYNAILIPDLDPGIYVMRIHLTNDFGVVKLPEFTFSDWQEKITVNPGRVTTIRSVIHHFNETIYSLAKLFNEDYNLTEKDQKINTSKSLSFTDRGGKAVTMKLSVNGTRSSGGATAVCTLQYEGKDTVLEVSRQAPEKNADVGKVRISVEMYSSNPQQDRVSINIMRTDVYQGMHKE